MELWTRRKFFVSSVVGGALAGAGRLFGRALEEGTIYRAPTVGGQRVRRREGHGR